MISGQATIDSLSDYPNYFRTIFANLDEARIVTQYLRNDLGQEQVNIVAGTSEYEISLADDFKKVFSAAGTVPKVWTIDSDNQVNSIAAIVEGDGQSACVLGATGRVACPVTNYALNQTTLELVPGVDATKPRAEDTHAAPPPAGPHTAVIPSNKDRIGAGPWKRHARHTADPEHDAETRRRAQHIVQERQRDRGQGDHRQHAGDHLRFLFVAARQWQ